MGCWTETILILISTQVEFVVEDGAELGKNKNAVIISVERGGEELNK